MTRRTFRFGLWLRMAVACLVLALATSALVAVEVLVLGVLVAGALWYTFLGASALGLPGPFAITVSIVVVSFGLVAAWVLVSAVRREADDERLDRVRREKREVLILASMFALALVANALPIETTPALRFLFVVLVGVYMLWWALTELDEEWPPDDEDEADGSVDGDDIANAFGRRLARFEATVDRRSLGVGAVALAAGIFGVYAITAAFALDPERLLTALGAVASLFVVGVHHGRVVQAELDEAAVRRELEADLGPWVDDGDESAGERQALERRVRRLAAQVDVPAPSVRLSPRRTPTAAAVGYRPASSTIVLSKGVLDALDERELDAVIAHELAHIANRDAAILTLLSFPGASARETIERQERNPFVSLPAHVVIATSRFSAATVARAREYAADDGAIAVTGDPSALASALETLDTEVAIRPNRDLRETAATFSIVPPPWEERRFFDLVARLVSRRLLGTHPPTARRIERLESRAREGS
ncbi:SprT-like domain-containing protein [Natrialbaceae archaeon A-arb3/5]